MLIDHVALRESVNKLTSDLTADPGRGVVLPNVATSVVENLHVRSTFKQGGADYVFDSDELPPLGGHGTAPSPMRYFLSGIAFCSAVWYAKCAALRDIELTKLDVGLTAYLDTRGEHHVDADVPSHPQWLAMSIDIASAATDADVLASIDDADERCPIGVLVRRALPVYQVVRNGDGELIRDSRPADVVAVLEAHAAR
jgi:uncharacterized OsmC-like protein